MSESPIHGPSPLQSATAIFTFVDRATGRTKQVAVIGTREDLLRFALQKGASVYGVPQPQPVAQPRPSPQDLAARLAAACERLSPAPPRPEPKEEKFSASLDARIREARAKRLGKRRRPADSASPA